MKPIRRSGIQKTNEQVKKNVRPTFANTIAKAYYHTKTSFVTGSTFYGLSLDKRSSVLDYKKFINDPWPGDATKGRNILEGILDFDNEKFETPLEAILERKGSVPKAVSLYVNSFSWIRDVQAVGWIGARRFIRNLASVFIDRYKRTKRFWHEDEWEVDVAAERMINWIFSYSFFADGADDDFQKKILSSITEHNSHITKIYKSENDPIVRLLSLKALLFFLSSVKNHHKREISNLLNAIETLVSKTVDNEGMYITRNPSDLFTILRSLIEVRFIINNIGIPLNNDVFKDKLSKIATAIRFFRMGDGSISPHVGDFYSNELFQNTQHVIDMALSLVDIDYSVERNNLSLANYDRLSTRRVTLILNKKVADSPTPFYPLKEQGLNIMDFNASFGTDNLVKKADITLALNGRLIKPRKESKPLTALSKDETGLTYMCELSSFKHFAQSALRREITLWNQETKLSVSELYYSSMEAEIIYRLVLDKKTALAQINKSTFEASYNKHEYRISFNIFQNSLNRIFIDHRKNVHYPTIVILIKNLPNKENQMIWSIESK